MDITNNVTSSGLQMPLSAPISPATPEVTFGSNPPQSNRHEQTILSSLGYPPVSLTTHDAQHVSYSQANGYSGTTYVQANRPETHLSHVQQQPVSSIHQQHSTCELSAGTQAHWSSTVTTQQLAMRKYMDMELPIFDGNIEDWPAFYSFYIQSTSSCGFSLQENLLRIMKSLKGTARQHVAGLFTVAENVPYLMERLKAIYGRPEQLIECQLAKIRRIPQISIERMDQLIDYGLAVHNLVSVMRSTGMVYYLSAPHLLYEIQRKLPADLALQWATFSRGLPSGDLVLFDAWLDNLTLDACRINSSNNKKTYHARVNIHVTQNPSPKTPVERPKRCLVCQESCQLVQECRKFKELSRNARWSIVKQNRLCALCLTPHSKPCHTKYECGVDGCSRRHNPLLHAEKKDETTSTSHTTHNVTHDHLFRVIPVTLESNTKKVDTFAFLDDGSSVTLLDNSVAEDLNLKGPTKPLCLQWTSNQSRMENSSKSVNVTITGNSNSFPLNDVRTVEDLNLPTQNMDLCHLQQKFQHLRNLPLQPASKAVPTILIGMDNIHLSLPLKVKEGKIGEPVAIESRLGWSVCGGNLEKLQSWTPNQPNSRIPKAKKSIAAPHTVNVHVKKHHVHQEPVTKKSRKIPTVAHGINDITNTMPAPITDENFTHSLTPHVTSSQYKASLEHKPAARNSLATIPETKHKAPPPECSSIATKGPHLKQSKYKRGKLVQVPRTSKDVGCNAKVNIGYWERGKDRNGIIFKNYRLRLGKGCKENKCPTSILSTTQQQQQLLGQNHSDGETGHM